MASFDGNPIVPGLQGSATVGGADISNYINPATDARLNSILAKTHSPLRQGIIQQTDDVVGGDQGYPYACRFMFNPGEIDVSYSVADNVLPPGLLSPSQLQASAIYPGATSISFSLLFDRTYEVHYPVAKGQKNIQKLGVYADIAFLEAVTGVRSTPGTSVAASGTTLPPSTTNPKALIGNMLFTPVYVIFGGGNGGQSVYSTSGASVPNTSGQQALTGLTYIAYITSMTVNYALFSENMVPTRCGVSLTMQQLVGEDAYGFQTKNVGGNPTLGPGGTLLDRRAAIRSSVASGRSVRTKSGRFAN